MWDPRSEHLSCKSFKHHQDYISSFAYNEPEKCVVVGSADGSLSVISMKERDLLYRRTTARTRCCRAAW